MRILHLLNHTRRLNGHVHAAVDLACRQVQLGHQVAVGSQGGDLDALLRSNGVETIFASHDRGPDQVLKSFLGCGGVLRRWRPDIVHAHMMTSAVLAWPSCKLLRMPLVTTVHNEFEKGAILMGLGNRVIAVSGAVAWSMRRRGIAGSRIDVVLNGTIGSARMRGRSEEPQNLDHPAIVFVGGLHPRKGLPDLLRAFDAAFPHNPAMRLYVVGGGPHQDAYERTARALPCADAITFAGPRDDPYRWMLGADIFVLPSHADPAPLVLSEAREAGCAIIGTNVDGIPELLEAGRAGILVPPGDCDALARALIALTTDPAQLSEWRAKSQLNLDHLRIDRVAEETLAVYRRAAGVAG
ncbi:MULTISPECIES: glycosyltransferase family 4 protein [Methylobacterium]|uniref:glycosyltransferase family 4 protein n=1 Tax=Methylobacterium TaxID=407 RepID=UPI0009784720|nr:MULTISPECIES: glycosyltransferase family 4 protein [Methylobacterium]ONF49457.1 glycosyl transferase [Methylobacterium radiotolerans]RUP22805.1 MAG: glycosyltransferase family 1 protein [Methylobacterium sp.]